MGKKAIITLDWSKPFSFLLAPDNPNEETECLLTGKRCVDFRKDMKADQVKFTILKSGFFVSGHLIHEPLELLRTILGFHVLQYFGLVGGGWVGETCLLEDVFLQSANWFSITGSISSQKEKKTKDGSRSLCTNQKE